MLKNYSDLFSKETQGYFKALYLKILDKNWGYPVLISTKERPSDITE